MNQYYFVIHGVKQGPFSIEELKEKDLTPSTLVWTEGMIDWLPAKDIENLQGLLTRKPPPIPKQKNAVIIANETKAIFKLLVRAFIIAFISFPVYYFPIYGASKFDNFNVNKEVHISVYGSGQKQMRGTDSITEDWQWVGPISYENVRRNIELRKEFYTEESWYSTLYTFLISFAIFILIRYISIATKWVRETSKE